MTVPSRMSRTIANPGQRRLPIGSNFALSAERIGAGHLCRQRTAKDRIVGKAGQHGLALLAAMGDALEKIEAAVGPLQRRQRQLRLSTVSTFALNWLLPRLRDFQARHPDIDLAVSTTQRVIDFDQEDVDCAIRHGHGQWEGLRSAFLFRETLVPAAKPGLFGERPPEWSTIRARSRFQDWTRWWRGTDQHGTPPMRGVVVETRSQALEAALAGAGVVLTDRRYLSSLLAEGRLVTLGPSVELPEAYFFVHRTSVRNPRLVDSMRHWLISEALEQGDGGGRDVDASKNW
ncbi:LysR substrate-binding domain-containing protein [Paracoccus yeei]|uniref:LysR family transcriptional regulator n=2 Tax=Paracoccus yeei TaxID=147645 RepID=A0A2D2C780_9RHOB|nr:LysR substrate-binding domain-containing protein [Paracoccus yeei]ATQ58336.1 LysR family transcriptional regulator [Paracoccus yeei]